MEIKNISEIQIPYEEQSLTEIICDKEFTETKDWYKEQLFVDEKSEIVARFIQQSSKNYEGNARQLSPKRKDLFVVVYTEDEDKSKHHYDIVLVKDLIPQVLNTYDYVGMIFNEDSLGVRKNGLCGFINENGEEFIEPQYGNVNDFENGFAVVRSAAWKCGLINKKNEQIVPFLYDTTDRRGVVDGFCVFSNFRKGKHSDYSYIYNTKGELIKEHHGEVYNLGNGNFAFETEFKTYEIKNIKDYDRQD